MIAIACNLLIDHHRAALPERVRIAIEDVPARAFASVHEGSTVAELELELDDALAALAQRDREILALRYEADLTGPEMVALTGLTLANVQQIISRSLRRLREALGRDDRVNVSA